MQSKISASGIGELLTGGKTAESYLLKKTFENLGIENNLSTKAMEHGIINQYEAYELIVSNYDNAKWHDIYTPINEFCGASADCIGDVAVWDIKCNFYVDTYLEQIMKLPKKYFYQSQMQMIAENKEFGMMCFYLTSSELDMYGNKIEYPYPLKDRYYIHEIKQDVEAVERILTESEKGYKKLIEWTEILTQAETMAKDEFFYSQFIGGKAYRKLKTAGSIENTIRKGKAFRVENEFYYELI